MTTLRNGLATGAAVVWLAITGVAWADPPGRAIRLAYTSGPVSFLPAGEDDWVGARINRPLWTGDRLWTDRGARGELELGGATLFVANDTSLSVLDFDDDRAQVEITQGIVDVWVRSLDGNDTIEIDTPNLAFVVRRPGMYRIDVSADGESTTVAIERGEGEAFGGRAAYVLRAGQGFRFYGSDLGDYESVALRRDPFATWVAQRVQRYERSASARYVSPQTIGYADLDANGTWRTVANYGPVWVPSRVDADWAPYRYGHWSWVDPWGWTWVDDAPWGFAPFHYGRWAYIDNRYWGWVPGPRNARPVYAPALVAFIGGDKVRAGAAGSNIGWFPLAPGEVYRPAFDASRDYFTRVNVTNTTVNVTNVTNLYNNPRITDIRYINVNNARAVTAIPAQAFVQAQPVQRAKVRVERAELQRTAVVAAAPVAPARASVTGGAPPAQARPAQRIVERSVVAKAAPPAPPPSIDRRQDMLKQQPGKPVDRADLAKSAPAQRPNVKVVEAAPQAQPIQPNAVRGEDRGRGKDREAPQGQGLRPTQPQPPQQAQPPRAPEPAAKGPEPSRPAQRASPEPRDRPQPPQAQAERGKREAQREPRAQQGREKDDDRDGDKGRGPRG